GVTSGDLSPARSRLRGSKCPKGPHLLLCAGSGRDRTSASRRLRLAQLAASPKIVLLEAASRARYFRPRGRVSCNFDPPLLSSSQSCLLTPPMPTAALRTPSTPMILPTPLGAGTRTPDLQLETERQRSRCRKATGTSPS